MDELTLSFLRRTIQLRGRVILAMLIGSFGFGCVTPRQQLTDVAALLSMLAAWSALGWAAADRQSGAMNAVLAAPNARRSWMVAYLVAAPCLAAGVSIA